MSTRVPHASLEIPAGLGPDAGGAWFEAWRAVRDEPALRLVLPHTARLEPAGQSWLAAGIAGRAASGLSTSIAYDPASRAAQELQLLDFFRVLDVELTAVFEKPPPEGRFVKLRRIESESIATELAREAADCLAAQFVDLPSSQRRAAAFLFEELGVNVVQHSGAPRTGFGLARAWPEERRWQISFCDAGVGFLASAQRHPEFAGRVTDEAEAILLALKKGLSFSQSPANMGVGLSLLQSFADELDADLWIASGDALFLRRTAAGRRVSTVSRTAGWQGAWVCFDARIT